MSVQTLYTAATGMESLQTKLDVIANNLANVNTTGYKKGRANFEDLFYRTYEFPGAQDQQQNYTAVGTQVGLGSRVQSVQTKFSQGAFQDTGSPLDVAIEGNGFFQVQDPFNGQSVYTRAGNFSINANNQLVVGSAQTGRLVVPNITLPTDTTAISITADGRVLVQQANQTQLQQQGQIELALFPNPEGLLKLGENLYQVTDASGAAVTSNPGQQGVGVLRQTFLEASNVEPVQELIDLITTQRSFELNSQAIQAGDQILQLISNLRRS
ncbi:Flagellar basal-body rod protein FlgG [Anatilimnocola aggregata]|uniref:Flagellar basal-body rod protein FlgG n=1 Tax=Anatilimnocola aggregata TaxID=2528021 RepID=A0A517YKU1_9BACT|nr:flagellar basal-body rod protein FlgG [Anatilimnocola aggregata]QDU30842.1 Flagellar basal-body rod protein FlgG [Anatilimnocola aggregata]